MTAQEPETDRETGSLSNWTRELSRLRLAAIGLTVLLLVFTGIAFIQAVGGYVSVYHLSMADASVVDYSTADGQETVEIRVDNPSSAEVEVTSVLIHGYVGEDAVNQDNRIGLDEPVTVPAAGSVTFAVELNVPPERRAMYQQADTVRFEGSLVAEYGDERNFIDIEPQEDER